MIFSGAIILTRQKTNFGFIIQSIHFEHMILFYYYINIRLIYLDSQKMYLHYNNMGLRVYHVSRIDRFFYEILKEIFFLKVPKK